MDEVEEVALSLMRRVPIFTSLNDADLERVIRATTSVEITAGDWLFHHGDPGTSLFVVESGVLHVVIDAGLQSERVLATFGAGDFFGEMALLTGAQRSASVRAHTDSRLLGLAKAPFDDLLEDNPEIAVRLSRILSFRLAENNEKLSRQSSRMSVLVPLGDLELAVTVLTDVVSSVERQSGRPVLLLFLGLPPVSESPAAQRGPLEEAGTYARPLPGGGHVLVIAAETLDAVADGTVAALLGDLRRSYGHVLICTPLHIAVQRSAALSRADGTTILACGPQGCVDLREHGVALAAAGSPPRLAYTGVRGQPAPTFPISSLPPIRLVADAPRRAGAAGAAPAYGVDSLGRALLGVTVGLALSGGAAQGIAHLGVLEALVRAGIPIDLIAGTSGGALYGALLASGLSIEDAQRHVIHNTRHNLRDRADITLPRQGLLRGARIEQMVRESIGNVTFDDLRFPLYAVAADVTTGEEVVVESGLVSHGVRASISVPGIFEPFRIGGRILVDGGVLNPLPVSVARARGANFVIAVSVPAPGKLTHGEGQPARRQASKTYSILSVVVRSYYFAGDVIANASAADADVLIKPAVEHFGWRDYRAAPAIIGAGRVAGQDAIERIKGRLQLALG